MPRQIIIDEQHRIAAVFSEEQVQELIVASGDHQFSDIYLGVVENVLSSIDAAFVNIGNTERNGFIHVSDLGPLRMKRGSGSITELVVPQQRVLVQVMKEPTGNKGPRLTGDISLPGRYLVLMPYGKGVNLSRRILDEEERNRLKALAILIKPTQMGLLVRTEAEGIPEQVIVADLELLQKQWDQILQQYHQTRMPGLLSRDRDFIQRVLRDTYSADVNRIVASPNGQKRVKQYLQGWNRGTMPPGVFVDAHRESTPILNFYRVDAAIRQALKPRVDLPSGGYIIIERTEALTVVDVNSGSFTQSATARETVLWTNCEAATEIARQLRLRNIGGVIVVDFIDMDSRPDKLQVLEHFNKALRTDKARPQIAQFSELGLVELTRKRQGQSLYEIFGRSCPTCDGLGLLPCLPGEQEVVTSILEPSGLGVVSNLSLAEVPLEESDEFMSPEDLQEVTPGRDRNGGRGLPPKPRNLRPGIPTRRPRVGSPRRDEPDFMATEVFESADPLYSEPREKPLGREPRSIPGPRDRSRPEIPEETNGEIYAPRHKDIPKKVLPVEMNEIEKKVYSELGLSPLLLLDEPVSASRDTLVTVVPPGGASAILSSTQETTIEPAPLLKFSGRMFESSDSEFEPVLPESLSEVPGQHSTEPDSDIEPEDLDPRSTRELEPELEDPTPELLEADPEPAFALMDTAAEISMESSVITDPSTPGDSVIEAISTTSEQNLLPGQQSPAASRRKRSR